MLLKAIKKSRRRLLVAVVAASALLVTGCSAGEPITPDPPVKTSQARKAGAFSDGQWAVGVNIEPGTYTTTVPDGPVGCSWGRTSDFTQEPDSYIEVWILPPGKKGRMVVKKSDVGVELLGGCEWKRLP